MTATVDVATLRGWLADGGEIAFLDVREEGQHGIGSSAARGQHPVQPARGGDRAPGAAALVPGRAASTTADGVAAKAARRLDGLGYRDVHVLDGGAAGWAAAGYRLFPSTNVPSKAFAEIIEHEFATPAISADELDRLRRSGESR